MNEAFILLGSNIGNRAKMLADSREAIHRQAGTVTRQSSVYETKAWGNEAQQDFLNQVIIIETPLLPHMLLHTLLQIEQSMGRHRTTKYAPRSIDLDILFYNETMVNDHELHIPHPLMQERRFVLLPLAEIALGKIHPLTQLSVAEMLENCGDPLEVKKI